MGKTLRFAIAVPAFALLAVACGGGDGGSPATTQPTSAATTPTETGSPQGGATSLVLKDNVFDPADFTIGAGEQITLMNEGSALHNLSVEGQDIDKDVKPGETEVEDLELPAGTYTMFCKYHRTIGMEGTLTVTG
jgi:plastocyanin